VRRTLKYPAYIGKVAAYHTIVEEREELDKYTGEVRSITTVKSRP
jgi:hypothetical protein